MKRYAELRALRLGLGLTAVLLTAMLSIYAVLFIFATQEVLRLDLQHLSPLAGAEFWGKVRSGATSGDRVLLRRVLDIHSANPSVADSHHCDEASADEFFASFLPDLIVASEDRRFYQHAGVDFIAFGPRAFRGKGASTLTMQLARTTSIQSLAFPVLRKPYEWALAAALEQNLSKRTILLHYSNSIYVGKTVDEQGRSINMDGVKTAAYHLFSKHDLRDLSLSEAAAIVALFTGPNSLLGAYWAGNSDSWVRVRNEVLRRVAAGNRPRYAAIVGAAYNDTISIRTGAPGHPEQIASAFYFFNSLNRAGRTTRLGRNTSIETTLDPSLQNVAAESLMTILSGASSRTSLELNGALVALDPATGSVRALVGGINPKQSELNRVHSHYSPGSTFKPFLYARAFDRGNGGGMPFTPAFRINVNDGSINGWTPNDHITGVLLPRTALAASSNRAALVVGKLVGLQEGCDLERTAFRSSTDCSAEVLLGGGPKNQVTPLSIAEAYASFANGGYRVAARFVETAPVSREQLFSEKAAFLTAQMLRSSIGDAPAEHATLGRGKRLAELPDAAEVAGKTGSTDTALWVAVVHPRLIVVVVAATDDNKKADGLFGADVAGAVWADFVKRARPIHPWYFDGHFEAAANVRKLTFDPERGCLSRRGSASEYFMTDRLPGHCD